MSKVISAPIIRTAVQWIVHAIGAGPIFRLFGTLCQDILTLPFNSD